MPSLRTFLPLLAFAAAWSADQAGSSPGNAPPGTFARLVERSDLDHDGRIDRFEANRRDLFEGRLLRAADRDQDGLVDRDEVDRAGQTGDLAERLARYDADRDRRLDIDELVWIDDDLVRDLLLGLDVNRDGVVDADESAAIDDPS
jgi:hypothetical protein